MTISITDVIELSKEELKATSDYLLELSKIKKSNKKNPCGFSTPASELKESN